jgi:rare lipoprotein A
MSRTLGIAVALAAIFLFGCGHKKRAHVSPPPPPRPAAAAMPPIGYTETGIASWYGHPYHGRPAADGEIYDMETFVAAHRTLPFNTWVRVVNLQNNKSVDVRIIDRGPFIDGRIIDLSHAAAAAIGLIGPGTGPVRMEVIAQPEGAPAPVFAVQVGAFRDPKAAERVRIEMESRYGNARVVLRMGFWRVLVGSEPDQASAAALAEKIRKNSPEKNMAFVVRIDSV